MFDYLTYNNLIALLRLLADIGCVWVVIYYCIKIVRNNSRTIQIFKGILFIFIIRAVASIFGLKTIMMIADLFVTWGFLAIIIIFQPEIRSLLEKLGKTSVFSRISTLTVNERERLVDELVRACSAMSVSKTGALISLEQGHSLSDYIKTGTQMNSMVTSELLCSIFVPGTPLHDGAVIIQGVKIACAAAYFPPTTKDLPSSYGARHRAAVGISEISDSVTIVVSEETGNISIARNGALMVVNEKELREYLNMVTTSALREVAQTQVSADVEQGTQNGILSGYLKGKKRKQKKEGTRLPKVKEANLDELEKQIHSTHEEDTPEIAEEKQKAVRSMKMAYNKSSSKSLKDALDEEKKKSRRTTKSTAAKAETAAPQDKKLEPLEVNYTPKPRRRSTSPKEKVKEGNNG